MKKLIHKILTHIPNLFRKFILKRTIKKFASCLEDQLMEDFLELLLKSMDLLFILDENFRKNIEGFNAKYVFESKDKGIVTSAIFRKCKFWDHYVLDVKGKAVKDPNITITFKDGDALSEFLFSGDPDVFNFIIENKLSTTGNLNYVLKFGYMAKHLKMMFGL